MTLSLLEPPPEDPRLADTALRPPAGWPAPPAPAAYHELLGEIVTTIAPHTEADPVAILTQLLIAFGAAVGRGAWFTLEATRHHANEFMLLVGDSSKAQKGLLLGSRPATDSPRRPTIERRILTGLSSGEGLIWAVRDPTSQDPAIPDQRLLVVEPEFASVLKTSAREISTLSPTLRCAWDARPLAILTRTAPARATSAHIALIGHITQHELRRHTTQVELSNGYLNRILLIACRRQRLLPEGGHHDPLHDTGLSRLLAAALKHAQTAGELRLDQDARERWHDAYRQLATPLPGVLGQITARAEAHTIRLALIYALANGQRHIGPPHLDAALSLHDYAARSAAWALDGATGQPLAEQIHAAPKSQSGRPDAQPDQRHPQAQPARRPDRRRARHPPDRRPSNRHPDPHRRPASTALENDPRALNGLLLLSYPTPRCPSKAAPPSPNSAALNKRGVGRRISECERGAGEVGGDLGAAGAGEDWRALAAVWGGVRRAAAAVVGGGGGRARTGLGASRWSRERRELARTRSAAG